MPPSVFVITGIVSVQVGAGLAGRTFGQVTPAAMTGLRLWTSAAMMGALGGRGVARSVRAVLRNRAWRDGGVVLAFGVTMGLMNFAFYQAIARIPLGVAVTIEFLGPLAVAVVSSRRLIDLLWVGLAAAGVALLSEGWAGLAGPGMRHAAGVAGPGAGTALAGVVFALIAAAGWATYILLSASTGRRFPGSSGLVMAMVVSAAVVTPAAVVSGGGARGSLLRPGVIGIGVAVGLLSSVIPYRLELEALRRLPARIFSIWMSLEPAIAALTGLVLLGEALAAREWAAIGCVIVACAGAARGGGRAGPAPPPAS
ncbi:MAG TPA: EamA family transporter [Streptosporangiaceae bacterium]|nr:EamA family transporter [Streptosporangiaceae bacterium]